MVGRTDGRSPSVEAWFELRTKSNYGIKIAVMPKSEKVEKIGKSLHGGIEPILRQTGKSTYWSIFRSNFELWSTKKS